MQRCQVEVSQLNHNYNGPKLSSEEFFEKKFRLKNPKHLAFHTPHDCQHSESDFFKSKGL